jgi:hypothetical protein
MQTSNKRSDLSLHISNNTKYTLFYTIIFVSVGVGVALKTAKCNQSAFSFCANCSAPDLVIIITHIHTAALRVSGVRLFLNIMVIYFHKSNMTLKMLRTYYNTLSVTVNHCIQNLHLNEEFPMFSQNKPQIARLPWMTACVYNRRGYDAGWPAV